MSIGVDGGGYGVEGGGRDATRPEPQAPATVEGGGGYHTSLTVKYS